VFGNWVCEGGGSQGSEAADHDGNQISGADADLAGGEHARTDHAGQEGTCACARVCAANSLLDRDWGKSLQRIASEDGTPLEFLHRIERVIVHPGDPANDPVIDFY